VSNLKKTANVTVTLRIPVDIYSHIEAVANEYDVSISTAFRIYLKRLQTQQTQQITQSVGKTNTDISPQTQQSAAKRTLREDIESWPD